VSRLDGPGFSGLYRAEAEAVLLFCARRVFDAEVALDLTAETFAQAYRGRRSFRGTTNEEARAWVYTIARRVIAKWLERGRLDRSAVRRLAIQVPVLGPDEHEEIERRAGLAELRRALAVELSRLDDDQRAALQLRVVEQRSYAEVSEALGVSEPTARARVSRGLRRLAVALEAYGEEASWTAG
jgi:RNA polymerase sigma factor (sigma-70 family)